MNTPATAAGALKDDMFLWLPLKTGMITVFHSLVRIVSIKDRTARRINKVDREWDEEGYGYIAMVETDHFPTP